MKALHLPGKQNLQMPDESVPTVASAGARKKRRITLAQVEPYLYLTPGFLLLLVFKYWPMVFSVILSFVDWRFTRPSFHFIGLSHYIGLFQRDSFTIALQNTPVYIIGLAPFNIVLPLILALILAGVSSDRLRTFYRTIIFSPAVLSFAITCMVWLWIFNPLYGVLNQMLRAIGLPEFAWLSDTRVALWSIVLVSGWKSFGYSMVLYLAGLASITKEYTEAAQIDGASSWQIFWKIKWPLLSPTTFFIVVTTIIFAAERAFIPINILTKGGPYQTTSNLSYAIYLFAFNFFDVGLASAAATLTFVLFMMVTIFEIRYLERSVHYEA